MPMVRAAVKDFIAEDKIAQNVNSDEAAVLGAAFYGATQSRQFKTKEYRVVDRTANGVEVAYAAEAEQARTIHTELFKFGAKTGVKKTLKLKRSEEFALAFKHSSGPEQCVPACCP